MKARIGLSIVMWVLVLGAFSACQETSKHKSQSTGSSQVFASSVVSNQDSLSDNRTSSSTNKATQSSQAQLQQPHSDSSSISASKANADSAISTSSSPDTDLSPKPKAITKKQAKDFCHSDWVKQHYICSNKYVECNHTQEEVIDSTDPYQCKILSLKPGLAVVLTLKDFFGKKHEGANFYYPAIDLIDISHLKVLDHFEDRMSRLVNQFFPQVSLETPIDHISHQLSLFSIAFKQSSNAAGTGYWKNKIVNIYQYKNNHLKRIVWGLELEDHYEFQDEKMENRLPKNVKNRCINKIEERLTHYQFIDNKARKEPDLCLNKVIKNKWIRGYHIGYHTANAADDLLCDLDKPRKLIKQEKDIIKKQRLNFNGKDYMIPKTWPEEEPFY